MPVQNSNSQISACPDEAIYLLQMLKQLHLIVYCVEKSILHFIYVLEGGYGVKYLVITPIKS